MIIIYSFIYLATLATEFAKVFIGALLIMPCVILSIIGELLQPLYFILEKHLRGHWLRLWAIIFVTLVILFRWLFAPPVDFWL